MADGAFRICVCGDFSGSTADPARAGARWRPLPVDRDNLDQVMEALAPRLDPLFNGPDGTPVTIAFGRLVELHPDHLLQAVPLFQQLRDLRRAIERPESFPAAAAALQSWTASVSSGASAPPPRPPETDPRGADVGGAGAGGAVSASPLEAALQATWDASAARADDAMGPWARLVRDIARPFAQPHIQTQQQRCLAVVDEAMAVGLRAILHHRAFRQLESAWRAVQFLVMRLDNRTPATVSLLNVSRQELSADLLSANDLHRSRLYRLLVGDTVGTAGGAPWSLLVGVFDVGPDEQDALLVQRLGEFARQAGAPWILGARDELLGWKGPRPRGTAITLPRGAPRAPLWQTVRQTPEAQCVGLVWPRFLLRLPYGQATSRIQTFPFEELLDIPCGEDYLWGNGAFLAAVLLAQSRGSTARGGPPHAVTTVDRLPLHIVEREGESWVQPCGEVWVHEDMVRQLVELGVMPLVSARDQDVAGIARFTSVAYPEAPLAGRW